MSSGPTADLNEFGLIQAYFAERAGSAPWLVLGIGDDAAIIKPPLGQDLVICSDTLIAGRHFPLDTPPASIAWKSLAVNLSDLAAMGAEPLGFLLNLSLPEADASFLKAFSDGLFELAEAHSAVLLGGDTTRGALSISITALGQVPTAQALRRDGAQLGDIIAVSGPLGAAAQALAEGAQASAQLRAFLDRPQPAVKDGMALRGRAHAVIDVSDGLASDLGHILQRSGGLGAVIDLRNFCRPSPIADLSREDWEKLALQGGDDYCLCASFSKEQWAAWKAGDGEHWQAIGTVRAEPGLYQRGQDDKLVPINAQGYQHFS